MVGMDVKCIFEIVIFFKKNLFDNIYSFILDEYCSNLYYVINFWSNNVTAKNMHPIKRYDNKSLSLPDLGLLPHMTNITNLLFIFEI